MNEDFVSFKLAKKLKEKGFEYNTDWYYDLKGNITWGIPQGVSVLDECDYTPRPTIAQTLKWLREEKKISVEMNFGSHPHTVYACWYCKIVKITEYGNSCDLSDFGSKCRVFDSWEEASLAGIEYTLDKLL